MGLFRMSMQEYEQARTEYLGRCLHCEAELAEMEPDARSRKCENCGFEQGFGMEELLIMGQLNIYDGEDEDGI